MSVRKRKLFKMQTVYRELHHFLIRNYYNDSSRNKFANDVVSSSKWIPRPALRPLADFDPVELIGQGWYWAITWQTHDPIWDFRWRGRNESWKASFCNDSQGCSKNSWSWQQRGCCCAPFDQVDIWRACTWAWPCTMRRDWHTEEGGASFPPLAIQHTLDNSIVVVLQPISLFSLVCVWIAAWLAESFGAMGWAHSPLATILTADCTCNPPSNPKPWHRFPLALCSDRIILLMHIRHHVTANVGAVWTMARFERPGDRL